MAGWLAVAHDSPTRPAPLPLSSLPPQEGDALRVLRRAAARLEGHADAAVRRQRARSHERQLRWPHLQLRGALRWPPGGAWVSERASDCAAAAALQPALHSARCAPIQHAPLRSLSHLTTHSPTHPPLHLLRSSPAWTATACSQSQSAAPSACPTTRSSTSPLLAMSRPRVSDGPHAVWGCSALRGLPPRWRARGLQAGCTGWPASPTSPQPRPSPDLQVPPCCAPHSSY